MYRMSLSTTPTFGTATRERSQGLRHLNGYAESTSIKLVVASRLAEEG